ncbi:GIY-YIG nuclease family protein [Poseidonocella sedimentorum]|uniref:DUF4357 domain-containing protein n=1 Tax=Poseidonocella sedimentorum TaxID=871652 RepID=A0A1I6DHK2_9RHOB|nr:GIY-YIG nuclease family protein [Poseidonocella sedimentorum]SFR04919.1 protein of unknown function [Poseidonocella sedimentorum]
MTAHGRSLELYFVDGRPDGMLTAEVFNWTGHVLRFPRTQVATALRRAEAGHTGVYILIGARDGVPMAYIGEAEDLGARLRGHVAGKDWWEEAVFITSAADNLHKAHVRYIEARLVEIAREVGAIPLENGNTPPGSRLSEAAIANMESFLETLFMILPAIRIDMFLQKKRSPQAKLVAETTDAPMFQFSLPRHEITAQARLIDGEMVVQKGSDVRAQWVGAEAHKSNYTTLHAELVANGTISILNNRAQFTTDYAFSSPSAAAAVISGRSTNGRIAWKLADGRTFQEWELSQVEDQSPTK